MRRLIPLIFFLLASCAHNACAITVYMQPFASPSPGHAGTIGDPYETWTEPCNALIGVGGTVILTDGTYTFPFYTVGSGSVTCSGASGNPIVFQGNHSIPTTPGANASSATINNISGSALSGRQIQVRYNEAYLTFQNLNIVGGPSNTDCIFFETNSSSGQFNHHITYNHLTMSSCGCNSLYMQGGDYYTITENIAHDNGSTCSSASDSAVHIYQPLNYDKNSGTHILVSGNILYNESKGDNGTPSKNSDGNGIQVPDDGDGTQFSWCSLWSASQCPYKGQVQIQNNIVYNNDGNGYSDFSSSAPVTVVNNTFYQNVANQTAGSVWSEITFNTTASSTLQVYNNIVQSRGASYFCNIAGTAGTSFTVTANANDNYACTTAYATSGNGHWSTGAANVTGNPQLTLATSDFTPQSGSAAFHLAIGTFAPSTDIFGNSRTSAGGVCTAIAPPDAGAIEVSM